MNVKEAVSRAKTYVAEIFDDESPSNIGLEEIRFDDRQDLWLITVGFSRSWNRPKPFTTALGGDIDLNRTYKVVHVKDDDGKVVSLTDRTVEQ
ncbi:hypothetical protein [Methylobacterium nigriterrae]|uniref:hypothetical protein n=1 Tax=Methylobacterium nigriterrae TaxID=3127512 RepID=UPI0030134744